MKIHQKYINRCIELAKNGLGTTYPNPLVGCVIVYNDTIIGEGWHQKAGDPHAEVMAINSVKEASLLSKSTLYVNLEPCSHYGKTPPCCDLIIKNEIPNVVIGTQDPFEKVSGNGIGKLIQEGKNVTVGVLEKECEELNKRFFTFHNKQKPYIILKWAESNDGFIAPIQKNIKEPFWLSNQYSRQLVHKWRSEEQAILVGSKTVLEDNPKLDVRDWTGKNPTRIILDKNLDTIADYAINNDHSTTIFITEKENFKSIDKRIFENTIFDNLLAKKVVDILYKNNIQSLIIEGGRQTLQTFIDANLWDEARIFKTKALLKEGIKAPEIKYSYSKKTIILEDELLILKT